MCEIKQLQCESNGPGSLLYSTASVCYINTKVFLLKRSLGVSGVVAVLMHVNVIVLERALSHHPDHLFVSSLLNSLKSVPILGTPDIEPLDFHVQ